MEEMERTSQRMPGIFKKISNFWILCQMDKKVGENYWMSLVAKDQFKILFYNFYNSPFQMLMWKNQRENYKK